MPAARACRGAPGAGAGRQQRHQGKRLQPGQHRCDHARHRPRRALHRHGIPRRRHRPRRQLPVLEPVEIRIRILPGRHGAQLYPLAAQDRQRHLSGRARRLLEARQRRQPGNIRLLPLLLARRGDLWRQPDRRRSRADHQPIRDGIRPRLLTQALRALLHGRRAPLHPLRPLVDRHLHLRVQLGRLGLLGRHLRLLRILSHDRTQRMPVRLGLQPLQHRHQGEL